MEGARASFEKGGRRLARLYRIHDRRYSALDGTGAALVGGRWNPRGAPAVYASPAYAGALLEVLARIAGGTIPAGLVASRLALPAGCEVRTIGASRRPGRFEWRRAQEMGRRWLESAESPALRVPSYVARPWGWNIVLNPAHPVFGRVRVVETVKVRWDARLFPKTEAAWA